MFLMLKRKILEVRAELKLPMLVRAQLLELAYGLVISWFGLATPTLLA